MCHKKCVMVDPPHKWYVLGTSYERDTNHEQTQKEYWIGRSSCAMVSNMSIC